jgi:hypothetical protein
MKVTFVSASVKTNNDTVRISSEPSSSTVNQLQTQNSKNWMPPRLTAPI